ncbi:hypothetical protein Tco_0442709 [Tanacetum coccineum]
MTNYELRDTILVVTESFLDSSLLPIQMLIGQAAQLLVVLLKVIVFFLGNNLLSVSSKRQYTLSRSSVEAEYRGVVNAVAEDVLVAESYSRASLSSTFRHYCLMLLQDSLSVLRPSVPIARGC